VAFKLGGVRLVSCQHGLSDAVQVSLLPLFWARLPDRMHGGNATDRNLYDSVAAAATTLGLDTFHGWRLLANLERLGAVTKADRLRWVKEPWPPTATAATFERIARPDTRRRCPTCGHVLPRAAR
jgi:hypothetical protein